MLHASDLARVPSVGLFGPTLAREFGFRFAPNITLQSASQMRTIPVEQVYLAVRTMLTDQNARALWRVD